MRRANKRVIANLMKVTYGRVLCENMREQGGLLWSASAGNTKGWRDFIIVAVFPRAQGSGKFNIVIYLTGLQKP